MAKPLRVPQRPPEAAPVIDWSKPDSKLSRFFSIREALWLTDWKRLATDSDGLNEMVKANLLGVFRKMDLIRELLGRPVFVKSAYRPRAYNLAIGGSAQSSHMANEKSAAVDFWCDVDGDGDKDGADCDAIKAALMPKLEVWGIRMEDNGPGARWVHVDTRAPGPAGRFFKP